LIFIKNPTIKIAELASTKSKKHSMIASQAGQRAQSNGQRRQKSSAAAGSA
jgi:hypothetical protein